jgi:steroid delta-isomerase-like uncharacterized protein
MSNNDAHLRVPLEVLNEGRIDLMDELFAADYVDHVSIPGFSPGRDGLREFFRAFKAAFPDLQATIVNELSNGDKRLVHIRMSGSMQGDFMRMPATGKSATWEEMHLVRMRDRKIAEHWAVMDQLGMLQQLGVIPTAPGT